ncbi:MAG: 2-amino-4-oxopentanoate thiolase subunit OrtA [Bacillota bacterium]
MSETARAGDWVEIKNIVMQPEERATNIPEETRRVPLELRLKGFLLADATIGDEVEIETIIGRRVRGELIQVNPEFQHDFGRPVPELLTIGRELRQRLERGKRDDG